MDRSGFKILSTLCLSHLGPFQHKLDSGHGKVGDICASHPLTWEISFAGERRLICFTATLSPGGQRVKVGETVGGGVEKHQSVEWGCFLTKRQEKCFSSVEEDNLIRIINIGVPTPTWLIRLNSFSDLMMLLSNTFRLLLIFILDHLDWKAFSSEITIVLEEACNH